MNDAAVQPTPRQWLIFAVVSTALLMSSIDSTIVATALPTMRQELHTSLSSVGWTLTGYTLGQIVIAPLAGHIGDAYGRKPIFLFALVTFTASSLLCGLVSSIHLLVPLRIVQAFGGGAFIPSAIGIISDIFDAGRARAVGLTSSILPAGGLIGPVLGAVLINVLSWRWIFFINVPVGLLLLVLAARVIPRATRRVTRYRPDLFGVVLLAALMLSIMAATTTLADAHSARRQAVVAMLVLVASAVAFALARHSGRTENPLVPMAFVTGPGFGIINLINVAYGACVLGLATLLPLYGQVRYHLSVFESGAMLTVRAVGSIVIATAASFLLERTGYRLPIFIGLSGIALGFGLTALPPPGIPALPWLLAATAITGIGFGLSTPAANNAALSLAPGAVGTITGLRGIGRQAGAIVAVSTATSVASLTGNQAIALAAVFGVASLLVLALLPAVPRIREERAQSRVASR
jgi:EmrB/QacA subfamily drug resistance transporter